MIRPVRSPKVNATRIKCPKLFFVVPMFFRVTVLNAGLRVVVVFADDVDVVVDGTAAAAVFAGVSSRSMTVVWKHMIDQSKANVRI